MRLIVCVRLAVFSFQNGKGGGPSFDGKFDGHLGNLINLSPKSMGMGVLLQNPVGNGIQLVEAGTGMRIKN
jgi:hypothetical protein